MAILYWWLLYEKKLYFLFNKIVLILCELWMRVFMKKFGMLFPFFLFFYSFVFAVKDATVPPKEEG